MHKEILYIVEEDISEDGGAGINERGFVSELLKQGIPVLISKPKYPQNIPFNDNILLYKAGSLKRRNPFKYLIFLVQKTRLILKISKKLGIEVFVFRWGPFPVDILFLGIFKHKKIYLKHLSFLRTTQKDNFIFNLVGGFRNLIIKLNLISGADTPSELTKIHLQKDLKIKNVLVSKNGTQRVNNPNVKKEKDFIYAGRLSEKRNTHKLLEVFKNSQREIDIYGFGEMEEIVKRYAKTYPNIHFKGQVSFEKIKTLFPKYKFGVDFTYVPTKYGKASYSQKIAQYLSFGMNVLAIESPDNQFILRNKSGVLIDLDKDNLASIVNDMQYSKPELEMIEGYIFNDAILKNRIKFWDREL